LNKESYDAKSKETPFQAADEHTQGARSSVKAGVGKVSPLPWNEAAASGLPTLWLLQGQSRQRSFRL